MMSPHSLCSHVSHIANRAAALRACSGVGFAARAQAWAMSNRLGIFMETWVRGET